MPTNNPYGAVPEALKESRLSLRDIMGDFLQTKVLEGRTAIEKAKVETESAAIAAGLEKEKLANLRDTAQLAQTKRIHDESLEQQGRQFEENLALQTTGQRQRHEIDLAQLANQRRMTDIAAAEAARKYETRTVSDWARREGIPLELVDVLRIDRNMKLPMYQAEKLLANVHNTFKENPAIGVITAGFTLKKEIETLQKQIMDPGVDPVIRAEKKKILGVKTDQFRDVHDLTMALDTPDPIKAAATAEKLFPDDPDKQARFLEKIPASRSLFHDNLAQLQTFLSKIQETPEAQEEADQKIPQLLVELNKRAPDIAEAARQSAVNIRKNSGPVTAAAYLDNMLNYGNRFPESLAPRQPIQQTKQPIQQTKQPIQQTKQPIQQTKQPIQQTQNSQRPGYVFDTDAIAKSLDIEQGKKNLRAVAAFPRKVRDYMPTEEFTP